MLQVLHPALKFAAVMALLFILTRMSHSTSLFPLFLANSVVVQTAEPAGRRLAILLLLDNSSIQVIMMTPITNSILPVMRVCICVGITLKREEPSLVTT